MHYSERPLDYKHPVNIAASGPNEPPEPQTSAVALISGSPSDLNAATPTSTQHTGAPVATSYVISETVTEDL